MKLTPAEAIFTSAWRGPGVGFGTSTSSIFSGPPGSLTCMIFIRSSSAKGAPAMDGGGVKEQIDYRERQQEQACEHAHSSRTGQSRSLEYELAQWGKVGSIEPEVIAVFIHDEYFH